jgi:alpha-ketoglutarate-dependent taurine dioxygenase
MMSMNNKRIDILNDIPVIQRISADINLEAVSDECWSGLEESGLVLLRGGQRGTDLLSAAMNHFGSRQIPLAGVDIVETAKGPVNRLSPSEQTREHYHHGLNNVPVHRENFFRGLPQPDLMFFLCTRPVAEGGETTFCDGAKVWQMLSKETRSFLTQHELVGHWYELGAEGMNANDDVENLRDEKVLHEYITTANESVSRLSMVCKGINAEFSIERAGEIFHTEFSFNPVMCSTLFGKKSVWCNSVSIYCLLQKARGQSGDAKKLLPNIGVTTKDGKAIPESILDDIIGCENAATVPFPWESGDLMVVDNTRVMHGRTAFNDTSRRLYNGAVYVSREKIALD